MVLLDGEEHALELREDGGELRHEVIVDGQVYRVDARPLGGGCWSLLVDGESYDLEIVADDTHAEKLYVALRGERVALEVFDERRLRMRPAGGSLDRGGVAELVAPMPGKVVKVLVEEGAQVAEGEGLVVVEAMKMENELKAPRDGTISRVFVEAGETVVGGARLLVLE